jgi:hypothetical protein
MNARQQAVESLSLKPKINVFVRLEVSSANERLS